MPITGFLKLKSLKLNLWFLNNDLFKNMLFSKSFLFLFKKIGIIFLSTLFLVILSNVFIDLVKNSNSLKFKEDVPSKVLISLS